MHIAILKDISFFFWKWEQFVASCSPSRFNFSLAVKVNPCSTQQNSSFEAKARPVVAERCLEGQ